MKSQLLIQLSCLLLLGASAKAETLSAGDRQFLLDSDQAGMTEIALGKAALVKTTDVKIKSFADQMILDHGKANKALKKVAETIGEKIPTGLDAKHAQLVKKFEDMDASKFDGPYVQQMIEDHSKVVAALRKEKESGENTELKDWAKETLPTVKEHLKMAEALD